MINQDTIAPEDKVKLLAAIKDMSTSMTRVAAEKDLQKNIRDDICKELDINKKIFSKLATTYYKQNFQDEVAANDEFETLYEKIVK